MTKDQDIIIETMLNWKEQRLPPYQPNLFHPDKPQIMIDDKAAAWLISETDPVVTTNLTYGKALKKINFKIFPVELLFLDEAECRGGVIKRRNYKWKVFTPRMIVNSSESKNIQKFGRWFTVPNFGFIIPLIQYSDNGYIILSENMRMYYYFEFIIDKELVHFNVDKNAGSKGLWPLIEYAMKNEGMTWEKLRLKRLKPGAFKIRK